MNERYTFGSRWAADHFEEASTLPEEGTLAAFRIPGGWTIGRVLDVIIAGEEVNQYRYSINTVRFSVTDSDQSATVIGVASEWALLPSEEVVEPETRFSTPLEAAHALLDAGLVEYIQTTTRTCISLNGEWTAEKDAEVVRILETENLRKTGLSKLTPEERTALGL